MMIYKTFQGKAYAELLATHPRPTIRGWGRLEGRPRRDTFDEALRAEIRDPLWLLTRQFQLGEYLADDTGSPVSAKIKIATTRIDRTQMGDAPATPYDPAVPLETRVERQAVPVPLTIGLQIGRYWLRLLAAAHGDGSLGHDYGRRFKDAFPITLPEQTAGAEVYAHEAVWQLHAAAAGRSVDGAALLERARTGDILADIAPDPADVSTLRTLEAKLVAWVARQYGMPGSDEASAWAPSYLEYQVACALPDFKGTGQIVLIADEYHRQHLDWYAFDIHPGLTSLDLPAGEPGGPPAYARTLEFLPATIEFAGMPRARWWEFEDRKTDFGAIRADTTDLAKLLLMEFGLIYANDWFLLPFEVDVGALCQIEGLAVTNAFGERIWIEAAGSGANDDWQRWSMYNLNIRGEKVPASTAVFVPPALARVQESAPVERVLLIRDEMANLVWGIEDRITLPSGDVQDGFESAQELLSYLEAHAAGGDAQGSAAAIRYRLMTSAPENWIPFKPVRMPAGDNRQIQLQRAAMLRTLSGAGEPEKVRPRGELLRYNLPGPYFVHEEEVPRAGAHVMRSFQRARWTGGRVCVWLGNRKTLGRGEGSSGLAFDQIVPAPAPPEVA